MYICSDWKSNQKKNKEEGGTRTTTILSTRRQAFCLCIYVFRRFRWRGSIYSIFSFHLFFRIVTYWQDLVFIVFLYCKKLLMNCFHVFGKLEWVREENKNKAKFLLRKISSCLYTTIFWAQKWIICFIWFAEHQILTKKRLFEKNDKTKRKAFISMKIEFTLDH